MTILLTNDDGISAPGLAALADALHDFGDIAIVAPSGNRSGIGHAITLVNPVEVSALDDAPGGVKRVSVSGTPADAVKYAIKHFLPEKPSLVVSGINNGPNVGVNVLYSGTVGAAFEAMIQGVDAVAVSTEAHEVSDWTAAGHYAREIVQIALDAIEERRTEKNRLPFCFNLNVPDMPLQDIKGLRWTRQGRSGFDEFYHNPDPKAPDKYIIDGVMKISDPDGSYDAAAMQAGYASVTPLKMDFTDHSVFEKKRQET